jgi:hypothetical protein
VAPGINTLRVCIAGGIEMTRAVQMIRPAIILITLLFVPVLTSAQQ